MAAASDPRTAGIREAISLPRMSTYDAAAGTGDDDAVALYAWNAQVSAAFMVPLHIVEVVTRNAAAEAIEDLYGSRWPWSPGFEQSLPDPPLGYRPRRDLQNARRSQPSSGKVIPEVRFVFWQKMFTARFDTRLWNPRLLQMLPHSGPVSPQQLRARIYDDLEVIRTLRNRIAHHEPVFARDLARDLDVIIQLVGLRSSDTASWLTAHEGVTALLRNRP